MTQEQKDLLLKDLCARLPYGVKLYCTQGTSIDRKKGWKLVGYHEANIEIKDVFSITVGTRHRIILNCVGPNNNIDIDFINDEVKPYLFPLSSMTEEQKNELIDLEWSFDNDNSRICNILECFGTYRAFVDHSCCFELIDWCIKNHFDYRGLIPMGLAIDATGLNIY